MNDHNGAVLQSIDGLEFMGENLREKLKFCGDGVRLFPLCKMIRAQNAMLDNHCQIFDNVFIDAGESLKIGKYSTLTWFVLIEGGACTSIGDRVFLGPGSKVLTSTYELNGFYSIEHLPDSCRATKYGDITIEDDAYIGANCTIMPGVSIHEGAVVGANSFVNCDLESWGIYVGAPCRRVGTREKPSDDKRNIMLKYDNWSKHF